MTIRAIARWAADASGPGDGQPDGRPPAGSARWARGVPGAVPAPARWAGVPQAAPRARRHGGLEGLSHNRGGSE